MKRPRQYRAIAEYYDAEYESSDVLDHDVPLLLDAMPKKRQRVLELCCGTARAAIPLAQAGHRVTGIDIDEAMLAIARRKRDSVGLSETQLKIVSGDVLDLEAGTFFPSPGNPGQGRTRGNLSQAPSATGSRKAFPSPQSFPGVAKERAEFDWAVLLFNTFLNFPTLGGQDRLLTGVRHHLRTGGKFWLDIFNPDLSILAEAHHAHFDSATFYVPALDRSVHRTTEICRSRIAPQLQEVTFHYTWADTKGVLHREKNSFSMTWMYPRELTLLLERNGFSIEALYGDYDRSPVTTASPRIIALAKKR